MSLRNGGAPKLGMSRAVGRVECEAPDGSLGLAVLVGCDCYFPVPFRASSCSRGTSDPCGCKPDGEGRRSNSGPPDQTPHLHGLVRGSLHVLLQKPQS